MAAITVTDLTTAAVVADAGRPTDSVKKSLRGAAGGVYIGPVISVAASSPPTSPTHATGAAAGGVEDSTGYRESDNYLADAGTGGPTGSAGATITTQTRPTGRTAYTADGVQGGSTPGRPIATGTDHLGGNFDKRSVAHESVPVGSRRRSKAVGETITSSDLGRPTIGSTADPSAGTVAVIDGGDAIDVDLHADDITGGANGRKGAEVMVFLRGTDTDTDGALVFHAAIDGGTDQTEASTSALIGAAANPQTVAVYARWRKADSNGKVQVGPWSARATLALA